MKKLLRLTALLAFIALFCASTVFSQDNQAAPTATDNTEDKTAAESSPPSSQEVEINEDTYRQFMELKDANRQGDIIPETVFKPGSGLQKLDKLPEESQKHLRNELREIIVDGDPWQPGDEAADYPYTPSAAASNNPALQKQEMEAWGELVDSYNQREAQIYADRAGNRAATSSEQGDGFRPGGGAGADGKDGEDQAGSPGQSSDQGAKPDKDDTAGAFSPDAVQGPSTQSGAGVSQNALEFLQGLGGAGSEQTGTPRANGGPSNTPASAVSQGQAQTGQQPSDSSATETQSALSNADSGNTGATQNAMEFLNRANAKAGSTTAGGSGSPSPARSEGQPGANAASQAAAGGQQAGQDSAQSVAQNSGKNSAKGEEQAEGEEAGAQGEGQSGSQGDASAQAGQQTETAEKTLTAPPVPEGEITFSSRESEAESTVGTSQNALEYLKGEGTQNGETAKGGAKTNPPPAGTLNIEDLLNAQGVGGAVGTDTETPASGEGAAPDQTGADKDGGGR
jgi:hypothetical protein